MFAKKFAAIALTLGLAVPASIAFAAETPETEADATASQAPIVMDAVASDETETTDDFEWAPVERDVENYSYVGGQANGEAYADAEGDDDYEWTPVERDVENYSFQTGRNEAADRQKDAQQ